MPNTQKRRMGRPTLNEAAALQERILDVALKLIRTAGSDGFSVDQLAAKVNITKRTIYRQYKSKTDLIIAVVNREVETLLHAVADSEEDTLNATADPIANLRNWVFRLFEYGRMPETISFHNYLLFEASSNIEIREQFIKINDHFVKCASERIALAQRHDRIRQGSPRRFALLLMDLTTGLQARSTADNEDNYSFGGDDPDAYFQFRWLAFLSLVSNQPWGQFISLADHEAGPQ